MYNHECTYKFLFCIDKLSVFICNIKLWSCWLCLGRFHLYYFTPLLKVSGKESDVILAAHYASEAVLGFFKNDNDNCSITEAINKIANLYSVKPVEGIISYQLQQVKIYFQFILFRILAKLKCN